MERRKTSSLPRRGLEYGRYKQRRREDEKPSGRKENQIQSLLDLCSCFDCFDVRLVWRKRRKHRQQRHKMGQAQESVGQ